MSQVQVVEVDIGGNTYRIGKLDAIRQFHVARRLLPALATMGLGIAELKSLKENASLEDLAPLLAPLSGVMASMPQDSADYVLFTCLSVVSRKDGERWARVSAESALMYNDIDLVVMLRLVFEVVSLNIEGFLLGLGVLTTSPSS